MTDLFGSTLAVPADDWPADHEEQFWRAYPRRVGKIAAMKALAKVRKRKVPFAAVLAGVGRLVDQIARRRTETQYVPHPTTWLNQGRWDDDPDPTPPRKPSMFEIATGRDR